MSAVLLLAPRNVLEMLSVVVNCFPVVVFFSFFNLNVIMFVSCIRKSGRVLISVKH